MAAATTSRTGKHRGFTIVELLVVLGLVGLLLAISMPAATRYGSRMRLSAAARDIMGLLSLARSSAISSRQAHAVVIDGEAGRVFIEDSGTVDVKAVTIPSTVTVLAHTADGQALEPPARLVFQPNGSLAGRSVAVTLSDGARSQTVTVAAATGAIIARPPPREGEAP